MSASGERQRAPGTVGCPRPRVQVTWADERAAHGVTQTGNHWQSALATKEILQRSAVFASNRRRPQRGRRPQTQKLTSACARRQCLPLSRRTHHRPLSPPTCLVCTAGGTDGFIAKLPPAGVLTGIKILPYERGQRTREGNFSQLRDKFSRSDSLKDKRVDGWGVIAGERQR